MWRRAWVQGVDHYDVTPADMYRVIQDEGRGLLMQGTREWSDYQVRCRVTPHLIVAGGVGIRVQGMRRYYGLLLARDGKARLVKVLDGEKVLAEAEMPWQFDQSYDLRLSAKGIRLQGWVDGRKLIDVDDGDRPLSCGAAALICEEGHMAAGEVTVVPVHEHEEGWSEATKHLA
jgi:hypothetical protein